MCKNPSVVYNRYYDPIGNPEDVVNLNKNILNFKCISIFCIDVV